jgi:TRAP transporter TAXI family solute receptor
MPRAVYRSAAAVVLCLAATAALAQHELLVGGGGRSGVYYQAALRLCAAVNGADHGDYRCLGRPSPGSVFNINAVARGLLDFGIAQSDRVWQARQGQADWAGSGTITSLRTVTALHPETVLLVARRDADIRRVEDLRGRRVNIGNAGSGQRGNAEDVLRIYGIDPVRDIRAEELQQVDASRALIDGKIDAFFFTVGNPSDAVAGPARAIGVVLVPIDAPGIETLVASSPRYVMTSVPAGTYPQVDHAVRTFAVKATLVTRAGQDETVVYDVVRALFEDFDTFRAGHPALQSLTREGMLEGLSAPLHPGAARYFRERGMGLPGGEEPPS